MVKEKLTRLSTSKVLSMTMYSRTRLANQVAVEVRSIFGPLAFETIIQRNIRLSEAPSYGKPALLYDVSSTEA